MYELKEVTLKNKNIKKKRLVINFHEKKLAILAEFLMSDASLLSEELTLAFNQISKGEKEKVVLSGNRCVVEIKKAMTEISDLFNEYDSEGYPSFKIPTEEFSGYVSMWYEELVKFNNKNA